MNQPVVSLWVGPSLGPIERMSLASFVSHGHPTALYAFDDIAGVPEGVELRDATSVLSRQVADAHRYKSGSYALFANLFRLELQRLGAGMWVDTDVVCYRPVTLDGPFVVGRESDVYLNNAVLRLAADSPLLADWLAAFSNGRVPPWIPYRRARTAYFRQLLGRRIAPRELPFGAFGPKAITALAERHGLMDAVQPEEVFYPVHPRQALAIWEVGLRLEQVVTERTLTIHLWNKKLDGVKQRLPEKGSLLDQLFRMYQV